MTFNGLLANFKVHFHSFFSRIFQFYLQFFRNFTSKRPLWQRIRSDFRQFRKFYVHLTICSCIIISRHARMYPSYTMNYNSYWLSGGAQFSTNFSTNSLTIEMPNTKDLRCHMCKFTTMVRDGRWALCFITLEISSSFFAYHTFNGFYYRYRYTVMWF